MKATSENVTSAKRHIDSLNQEARSLPRASLLWHQNRRAYSAWGDVYFQMTGKTYPGAPAE